MSNDSLDQATETTQETQPAPAKGSRLTQSIPTDRINFTKQLEILRAYGAAYDKTNTPVSNQDVAGFVGMQASTVGQANSFFTDSEFLAKAESGKYIPAAEVLAYFKAFSFNSSLEKSALKLAPLVEKSWFGRELIPMLKFRPMNEGEAIEKLADVSGAETRHVPQLKMIVEYMVVSGIVVRDADTIKLNTNSQPAPHTHKSVENNNPTPAAPAELNKPVPVPNGINFNISLQVDMHEMAGWEATRITAFFNGIANVLAAKGAADKKQ